MALRPPYTRYSTEGDIEQDALSDEDIALGIGGDDSGAMAEIVLFTDTSESIPTDHTDFEPNE